MLAISNLDDTVVLTEFVKMKLHWEMPKSVGTLVTLVAVIHYFDMCEFSLTFTTVSPNLGSEVFWHLLIDIVVMLASGHYDANYILFSGRPAIIGLVCGLCGWATS